MPEYVVEIYISPQLRERDPGRPLSLLEALDIGRTRRQQATTRKSHTEASGQPEAAWTAAQLRGKVQRAASGLAGNPPAIGPEHPAVDREAAAVSPVECACNARPGVACSPSGDHLARYLNAERQGAIGRQTPSRVIAGLDVITPAVIVRTPGGAAAKQRAAGRVNDARLAAGISLDSGGAPGGTRPTAATRGTPDLEAGA